jgi:hypothetical protein
VWSPSRAVGVGLSGVIRLLQVFRRGKPVHPAGVSLKGTLQRVPAAGEVAGVQWLDEPGEAAVHARLSRGLGLPDILPDIVGLALRVEDGEGSCDVLLASTGRSRPGRFMVLLRRRVDRATLGSMMPYRGAHGPILLAARTLAPAGPLPASLPHFRRALEGRTWRLGLYWSRPLSPWFRFGTIELGIDPDQPDTPMRFDPVLSPPRGARTYDWTRNLRERSYRLARRLKIKGPSG